MTSRRELNALLPHRHLSVVLPVYNVSEYLADCLDSLLAVESVQQVVVVDDASPDDSWQVVERYIKQDSRVLGIRNQTNLGLGASRNVGLGHCTGEFAMFVDSDDLVDPAGVDLTVETLRESGSDFATSLAEEFGPDGEQRYWTQRVAVFDKFSSRTNVWDKAELIRDHTAWTKIFRRDFLLSNRISYPTDTTCEDVLPSAEAYLSSNALDVVPERSYWYRRRPGSITSALNSDRRLGDWGRQTNKVIGMVEELGNLEIRRALLWKIMNSELPSRLKHIAVIEAVPDRTAIVSCVARVAYLCDTRILRAQDPELLVSLADLLRSEDIPLPQPLKRVIAR